MDTFGRLTEIARCSARDRDERLRVEVHEREPRALHLHHDPVTAAERVVDVGHLEVDGFDFARYERLGPLEAFPELPTHRLAADQLLVAAHRLARHPYISGRTAGGA